MNINFKSEYDSLNIQTDNCWRQMLLQYYIQYNPCKLLNVKIFLYTKCQQIKLQ